MTVTDIPTTVLDWSPVGLLGLVVLLILTDRLVTRKRLEEEQARTAKAEQQATRAVDLVEKVSGQVTELTEAAERQARTDDLAVALLRGIRRHLGIQEDPP